MILGRKMAAPRGGDALEVGDPPRLQGSQPMPSPCLPDAKCRLTVTAPNRFGNLLQPPV